MSKELFKINFSFNSQYCQFIIDNVLPFCGWSHNPIRTRGIFLRDYGRQTDPSACWHVAIFYEIEARSIKRVLMGTKQMSFWWSEVGVMRWLHRNFPAKEINFHIKGHCGLQTHRTSNLNHVQFVCSSVSRLTITNGCTCVTRNPLFKARAENCYTRCDARAHHNNDVIGACL